MKTEKILMYESPRVEVINVQVEKGFATSQVPGGNPVDPLKGVDMNATISGMGWGN